MLPTGREKAVGKKNRVTLLVPVSLHIDPAGPHPVSSAHEDEGTVFLSLLNLDDSPQPEPILDVLMKGEGYLWPLF